MSSSRIAGQNDVEDYGSIDDSGSTGLKHLDIRSNSVALTGAIIVADVVGAGILSMPNAFANFGWALGTFLTLLLLAMNVHVSILMWRVYMKFPESHTFMEMTSSALGDLPDNQRDKCVAMVGLVQYSFILAMLCLYALSLGKGIGMLFYKLYLCLPSWTAIGCVVIIPFFMSSRTLGTFKSLMFFNMLTIVGSVVIPLLVMVSYGVETTRPAGAVFTPVTEFNAPNWFAGLSTMTFAFTSQFMITEICAEMKDYREFPKAYINYSMPFQVAAYLIVGFGGYYFKGDGVTGMIIDNIPFSVMFQMAAFCLVLHMVITYFLKGVVLGRAIHTKVAGKEVDDDTAHAWTTWTGIVFFIVIMSYIFANVVPFFEDFVDLLGASLTPVGCYIIPICIYWMTLRDHCKEEEQPGILERTIIYIEMVFAIVMMFVGTYDAVLHIMKSWDTYGAPFDCHCHDIWNTCECSATHPGMEYCKQPTNYDDFLLLMRA